MTTGHKHRVIHIKTFDVWWVRLIRLPVFVSRNRTRVDASPYPYAPLDNLHNPMRAHRWGLTTFGILHRWTGLTLCNSPRPCPDHDPHCGDETCDDDHTT